jgi:hypothetical protein
MAPGFLEHLGVLDDFATRERAQSRHDIASQPAAAHDNAEDLALGFPDPVTGNIFGCDDQHDAPSESD